MRGSRREDRRGQPSAALALSLLSLLLGCGIKSLPHPPNQEPTRSLAFADAGCPECVQSQP